MSATLTRYQADHKRLLELGGSMYSDIFFREIQKKRKLTEDEKSRQAKTDSAFRDEYQNWYTEALAVIRQLTPDRLAEFEELYKGDGKRRQIDITTFTIQDWLMGMSFISDDFDGFPAAAMRFTTQLNILRAAERRFSTALFDIRQMLQADLFDSELDAAKEMTKNGFLRGAGAVAGVVLEKHLAQVVANHAIVIRKHHPTISDLNDILKSQSAIDIPVWRSIQRLGDLRNLASHNKHREPTLDEVTELIDGVDKITKTLF